MCRSRLTATGRRVYAMETVASHGVSEAYLGGLCAAPDKKHRLCVGGAEDDVLAAVESCILEFLGEVESDLLYGRRTLIVAHRAVAVAIAGGERSSCAPCHDLLRLGHVGKLGLIGRAEERAEEVAEVAEAGWAADDEGLGHLQLRLHDRGLLAAAAEAAACARGVGHVSCGARAVGAARALLGAACRALARPTPLQWRSAAGPTKRAEGTTASDAGIPTRTRALPEARTDRPHDLLGLGLGVRRANVDGAVERAAVGPLAADAVHCAAGRAWRSHARATVRCAPANLN